MSTKQSIDHHSWWRRMRIFIFILSMLCFFVQFQSVVGLSIDGVLLLSFKYSVLSDPLGVLQNWNYNDQTPCSWNGVSCGFPGEDDSNFRVVSVELPSSQLLASVPADLGLIEHLQRLDLSNNSINGSIPLSLFQARRLQVLDLSDNLIGGELPEAIGGLTQLRLLNLTDNALAGNVPANLTTLRNLKVVSLKNNYFSGELPSGFESVEILDLSSNLINGSLPRNFSGNSLKYLNVSYNRISGEIPPEFSNQIPTNATIDLSYNNITGVIPENSLFLNQEAKSYAGNAELCGKPLKNVCPIPSSVSIPPNAAAPNSPPALAAIPKTIDSSPATGSPSGSGRNKLRMGTIIGIVAGDIAGVAILGIVFLYVYQLKKKRKKVGVNNATRSDKSDEFDWASSSDESKGIRAWGCLRKQSTHEDDDDDESSESSASAGEDEKRPPQTAESERGQKSSSAGALVTVDGDREMELETLLKASAYILGATGSSIMYKAVLEDGSALAVRRIGESGLERFRDFENQVRVIGKLVHPNLVRIRGFYWGSDDKLVIYDFVPNGSLANARYRKVGTSPCHLPWEVRLKIAKGVARGLSYIHDKKHVHGNLKPTNILLGSDMEPKIGDFGLERLVTGESGYRPGGSARNFGSKRSTASRESFQDSLIGGATPSPSPSSIGCISPYYAPESLRSLKPNTKWDVFSFGIVLLELLTGKVIVSDEMGPGPVPGELTSEDKCRVLRMADVSIRVDLEGKEESLLALLRLGFSCISTLPHKRPTMKEVLHALEKFSSSSSYNYGHH